VSHELSQFRRVVLKVGSALLVDRVRGRLNHAWLAALAEDIADLHAKGADVLVVSSGAIAMGRSVLGLPSGPLRLEESQAAAAVGQIALARTWSEVLAHHGITAGQILVTLSDTEQRRRYLNARATTLKLLEMRAVPVINESDTVATSEIRYGDNDRLAALVSHLVGADLLVLLTDTAGLFTADPRIDAEASLIEEIVEVDAALESLAGGRGTERGSGGMATKLAAAKIAAWSGVRAVIAAADAPDVVSDAIAGRPVGTAFPRRGERLSSRKLWIAFALNPAGRVVVDDGARRALCDHHRSLLPAGVREVEGTFDADDAVEIVGSDGLPFAKGLVKYPAATLRQVAGRQTSELGEGVPHEVVHRDDLVVLPA
jgi:glutamate 5-kinase